MLGAITFVHFSTFSVPHTFLTEIREADIVAGTVVTSVNLQVGAILWRIVAIELLRPVSVKILVAANIIFGKLSALRNELVVGNLLLAVHWAHATEITDTVAGEDSVIGVLVLHGVANLLKTNLLGEINPRFTGSTTFSCHHDDTIGAT